jgi:hypothetical protein
MGTKKKDKLFTWLKVLHLLDDLNDKNNSSVHKKLEALNKRFYIRERNSENGQN